MDVQRDTPLCRYPTVPELLQPSRWTARLARRSPRRSAIVPALMCPGTMGPVVIVMSVIKAIVIAVVFERTTRGNALRPFERGAARSARSSTSSHGRACALLHSLSETPGPQASGQESLCPCAPADDRPTSTAVACKLIKIHLREGDEERERG